MLYTLTFLNVYGQFLTYTYMLSTLEKTPTDVFWVCEIETIFSVHSDSICVNVSSDMSTGGLGPLYVIYVM